MKTKEKKIVANHADRLSRLLADMRSHAPDDPYDSDKHRKAREYLEQRSIQIRALRKSHER